jgi:hypothetical protein
MRYSVRFLFLALLIVGCNRSTGPKPLALEEIPAALREAFQPAKRFVRQSAESIAKLVEQNQIAGATIQLQSLLSQQLNDEQSEIASAALHALNQLLNEQAAAFLPPSGEKSAAPSLPPAKTEEAAAAAAVMEHYIRTK